MTLCTKVQGRWVRGDVIVETVTVQPLSTLGTTMTPPLAPARAPFVPVTVRLPEFLRPGGGTCCGALH